MAAPTRIVSISARPAPLTIDLAQTAVLVVDMQNDFGSSGGMFDLAGIDLSVIQQAVPPSRRVVAAARRVGVPIIYLKMAHRPDLSDTGGPRSPHWFHHQRMAVGQQVTTPAGQPSRILIEGHMEYRDPARACAASRGYCGVQAPLQRLLRNGFGRATPNIKHSKSGRDRMHYQRLRRVRLSAMRCSVTTSAYYWKTAPVSRCFRARRLQHIRHRC